MKFKEFKIKQQNHVKEMLKDIAHLFVVDLDKEAFWNLYLDSFPEGTNKIFRKRREFDCSCCRHFIKSFGNVVSIKDNKITTIWDFDTEDPTYQPVIDALSAFVTANKVSDVFVTRIKDFGTERSHEKSEDNQIISRDHFFVSIPERFIDKSTKTEDSVKGFLRDVRNVFKRSLDEITEDSIKTVLELIAQNSLYKGEEWDAVLKQFLLLHKKYHSLESSEKENFCWEKSVEVGPVIGKIRGHSIGILLTDIANGVELNEAVRKFEAIVAPENYKRSKPIFTQKMLDNAKKKIEELGLMDSLERRFATIDDITVNNILFANRDVVRRMSGNIFEEMSQGLAVDTKNFKKVEEISINDFIKNVLPTTTKIEVLFENKHISNLVSLISPKVKDSKTMFKWGNGFSWAYKGNITDSMKERVKAAGGKVDGVLRFSIQWNEEGDNNNDFDAHCKEPNGNHIYFATRNYPHLSSGKLDVDITVPGNNIAVENITWSKRERMQEGEYHFYVHNFANRGGKSGFSAEIEFDGQIYSFNYNKALRQGQTVDVAKVIFDKTSGFKIKEMLPSTTSSREMWKISTNQFHPLSVLMFSPNYWDEQDGIGNKHYFFMLKNCVNDELPNGFFNEYLKEELMPHRKVFEALGSKMSVEYVDDQLSGIGFSSTQRNELVCKVEGQTNRMLKIKF